MLDVVKRGEFRVRMKFCLVFEGHCLENNTSRGEKLHNVNNIVALLATIYRLTRDIFLIFSIILEICPKSTYIFTIGNARSLCFPCQYHSM
jgi:hypothetical protein